MSRAYVRASVFAVATGLLGVVLSLWPAILEWEETAGLGWLFAARGPLAAPEEVAVVSVSVDSAAAVGQAAELDEWPRSLHAQLIDRLVELGASVIVFDVIFDKPRVPEHDRALATSIRNARNVILLERVRSEIIGVDGTHAPANAVVETRVPPIPQFKEGALASAPFTVPAVPFRVAQYWTFGRAAGDTPSLPVAALQAFLLPLYGDFLSALSSVSPDVAAQLPGTAEELVERHELEAIVRALRGEFARDSELAPKLRDRLADRMPSTEYAALFAALIDVYAGKESRYLNYYGPAGTIRTIPYDAIVSGAADRSIALNDTVVFVGLAEQRQPEQQDDFYSVFSERSGQNLSGVEIGATAFANLLERTSVAPLSIPLHLLLVLAWGVVLGIILISLPVVPAVAAALAAGALYAAVAYWVFRTTALWLPIVTPLLIQLPVAVFAALSWNYRRIRVQRERIRTALGYYVPVSMANRLAQESLTAGARGELLHGTCLFTDAEQYTAVAEAMEPTALGEFMNDYYRAMFKAVERHDGQIADLAGDSMVAVWAAVESDPRCGINACRAALDVLAAVNEFNRVRERHVLPTRVGLDSGQMLLGNVGAGQRYEYRAVGDIVSTASRIQDLNRLLGTQILVSGATLTDAAGFVVRDVGAFLLRGKTAPLQIHELREIEERNGRSLAHRELIERFSAALESFRNARWAEAEERFASLLQRFPEDGPSRYYAGLCAQYRDREPAEWRGVVAVAVR